MDFEMGNPTRNAYGDALRDLGGEREDIIVLDADLSKSTRTYKFAEKYPDRFHNVGIQEANLVGLAAGFASTGWIPYVSSFACFLICRAYDQIRVSVAYAELPVKFVASHGGISGGEDGVTQQSVEDIALMTATPGVSVLVPADETATCELTHAMMDVAGPVYMRTGRPAAPIVYDEEEEFFVGGSHRLRRGDDVTIVACGLLVAEALKAASALAERGIDAEVIDAYSVKPLDRETIVNSVRKTGHLVVAEEHQIWGGVGSAVARTVSEIHPVPMEFVAIDDTYAESGDGYELLDVYGLTSPSIQEAVETVLSSSPLTA